MSEPVWIEVTDDFDRRSGGERWLRRLDDKNWISVLYRLTGFGYHEWETALCLTPDSRPQDWPSWKTHDCLIIAGDRREELERMPLEQLRAWYEANISGNKNSFGNFMDCIASA